MQSLWRCRAFATSFLQPAGCTRLGIARREQHLRIGSHCANMLANSPPPSARIIMVREDEGDFRMLCKI